MPREITKEAKTTANGTLDVKLKLKAPMSLPSYQPPLLNEYFRKLSTYFEAEKDTKNLAPQLGAPFVDVSVNYKEAGTSKTVTIKAFPVTAENLTSLKESSLLFGHFARRYIALRIDSGLIRTLRNRYAKNGVQMVKFATNHNQKLGLNWSVARNQWEHFSAQPARQDGYQPSLP